MKKNKKVILNFLVILVVSIYFNVARADFLTLHISLSPAKIFYSSPAIFASSTMYTANYSKVTGIGHMAAEISCNASESSPEFYFSGGMTMAPGGKQMVLQKIKDGHGFQALLDNYAGIMHDESEISKMKQLECKSRQGYSYSRYHSIKHLISASTCKRLVKYLAEFKSKGLDQVYGGLNTDPQQSGAGANCSYFATSFINVAGLNNEKTDSTWFRNLIVPLSLFGNPPENPVPLTSIITTFKWGMAESDVDVSYPDPELVFPYLKKLAASNTAGVEANIVCGKSWQLVVDSRNVPTPTEPIWNYK